MESIVLVTGTPGVGKTSFAGALARKKGSLFLDFGKIVKAEKLYNRYDRKNSSLVIDERRARGWLKEYFGALRNRGIVVEVHSLGAFMPITRGMVAVVLRLDPVVLAGRLKARGWGKRKVWENVEAEMIDLCLYEAVDFLGPKRVYQVDATGKDRGELLHDGLKLLASSRALSRDTPNWLDLYDPIELSRRIL